MEDGVVHVYANENGEHCNGVQSAVTVTILCWILDDWVSFCVVI